MNQDMSYDSKEAGKQSEGKRSKGDRGGNKKGRRSDLSIPSLIPQPVFYDCIPFG